MKNFETLNKVDMKIKLPLIFLFTIVSFTVAAQLPDSVKPGINKKERSISLLTGFDQANIVLWISGYQSIIIFLTVITLLQMLIFFPMK